MVASRFQSHIVVSYGMKSGCNIHEEATSAYIFIRTKYGGRHLESEGNNTGTNIDDRKTFVSVSSGKQSMEKHEKCSSTQTCREMWKAWVRGVVIRL
jgi:hypothetical protein